jgi:Protein of unknown function (DUF2933)
MDNHNNNNNDHFSSMMWMMVICCLGPIAVAFFVGKSGGRLSSWWILGLAALCLVAHAFMHRGHKHPDAGQQEENKSEPNQLK